MHGEAVFILFVRLYSTRSKGVINMAIELIV